MRSGTSGLRWTPKPSSALSRVPVAPASAQDIACGVEPGQLRAGERLGHDLDGNHRAGQIEGGGLDGAGIAIAKGRVELYPDIADLGVCELEFVRSLAGDGAAQHVLQGPCGLLLIDAGELDFDAGAPFGSAGRHVARQGQKLRRAQALGQGCHGQQTPWSMREFR